MSVARVVLFGLAPPNMQLWKLTKKGWQWSSTHCQYLVSQNSDRAGCSKVQLMPKTMHVMMSLALAAYTRFADSTRSWSRCPKLGSPSGKAGLRKGFGAFGSLSIGISRAREHVPHGMPKWQYLQLRSLR